MIPSFLLAKLYVKGSLKNNESGFEFASEEHYRLDHVDRDRSHQRG